MPFPAVLPKRSRQTPMDAFNQAALTTPNALPEDELVAVTGWLLSVSRSPETISAYARDLGQFAGFIAQLDGSTLATATHTHVDAWWQWMRTTPIEARGGPRPRALKTIGRKLGAVSSFYRWAMEPGNPLAHLDRNPARPTRARRTPKSAGRRTPALTAAQLQAVVSACPDPITRALVLLLASTGARISEVLSADRGDWREIEGAHVLSIMGKGAKERNLVLPPQVVDALKAAGIHSHRPQAPLFLDPKGQRLNYGQVSYALSIIAKKVGLPQNLTPHQFRASYATRARIDHNADVSDIAGQLGHASPEMTQIYIREARAAAIGADLNERLAAAMIGGAQP